MAQMDIQLESLPFSESVSLASDVAFRTIENVVYVYSLKTGETSLLPGIGRLIWERLAHGMTLPAITSAISDEFSIEFERVKQDVLEFIQHLYSRGLITIADRGIAVRRTPADAIRWQPLSNIHSLLPKRFPFRIDFELTYTCNLKCDYCYTPKDDRHLFDTREIETVLDQLERAGTLFLCLTGGEPFSRRDLETIIIQARERAFAVLVLTNATLITPAQATLLAHTSTVQVSLHGAQAATHDGFTGIAGSFERACRGIEYLAREGAKVYVIFNATYRNIQEEEDVRRLCERWGVGLMLNIHLLPSADTGSLDALRYRISDEDIRRLARMGKLNRSHTLCTAAKSKARISPYGHVYPCELVRRPLGNLRAQPFNEIWESTAAEQFLASDFFATPQECQECTWQMFCRRCPALAEIEDGHASGRSSEACRVARLCHEINLERR